MRQDTFRHSEEVVHREDTPYEYYHGQGGDLEGHEDVEFPIFDPHRADEQYVMDHGEQRPAAHHYEHDLAHGHYSEGNPYYGSATWVEDDHDHEDYSVQHEGAPYWRGDEYDDRDK